MSQQHLCSLWYSCGVKSQRVCVLTFWSSKADSVRDCYCRWMTIFSFLCNVFHQVWQCGGSVEVLPCARIAHIERAHKPYTEDLTSHVRRNALRVAEVWMDEFKSHVYMAWNIPVEVSWGASHRSSLLSLVSGWNFDRRDTFTVFIHSITLVSQQRWLFVCSHLQYTCVMILVFLLDLF